jgi:hypothetical protein
VSGLRDEKDRAEALLMQVHKHNHSLTRHGAFDLLELLKFGFWGFEASNMEVWILGFES